MERYPIILDDENAGQIRLVYVSKDAADLDRLRAWYDALDCTCVEHVQTIFPDLHLLVDESGKMKDPQKPSIRKPPGFIPVLSTAILSLAMRSFAHSAIEMASRIFCHPIRIPSAGSHASQAGRSPACQCGRTINENLLQTPLEAPHRYGHQKKDLSAYAGISPATVTKMGRSGHVTTETIAKICSALNVSIGEILELVPDDSL